MLKLELNKYKYIVKCYGIVNKFYLFNRKQNKAILYSSIKCQHYAGVNNIMPAD